MGLASIATCHGGAIFLPTISIEKTKESLAIDKNSPKPQRRGYLTQPFHASYSEHQLNEAFEELFDSYKLTVADVG